MPNHTKDGHAMDHRQYERRAVEAPYSEVKIRRDGKGRFALAGHVYDISAGGMRFELDQALQSGEKVEAQIRLPGMSNRLIRATGRIVRFHDPGETGPVRMGLMFTELARATDRQLLDRYIHNQNKAA